LRGEPRPLCDLHPDPQRQAIRHQRAGLASGRDKERGFATIDVDHVDVKRFRGWLWTVTVNSPASAEAGAKSHNTCINQRLILSLCTLIEPGVRAKL